MRFVIHKIGEFADQEEWTWWVENPATDGETVASAPEVLHSEDAARSAVYKARKAFAGAKFARVDVLD